MSCSKRKLDRATAEYIVATNARLKKPKRRKEVRCYYCKKCRAYHTTSKEEWTEDYA